MLISITQKYLVLTLTESEYRQYKDVRLTAVYDGDTILFEESDDGYPVYVNNTYGAAYQYWIPLDKPVQGHRFGPMELDIDECVELPEHHDRPLPAPQTAVAKAYDIQAMIDECVATRLASAIIHGYSVDRACFLILQSASNDHVHAMAKESLRKANITWTHKRGFHFDEKGA